MLKLKKGGQSKMKKRRSYSREFKIDCVRLSERSDKTLKEIASDLGISYSMLCKWRGIYLREGSNSFPGKGNIPESEREKYELKKRIMELEEERDILKKVLSIFS